MQKFSILLFVSLLSVLSLATAKDNTPPYITYYNEGVVAMQNKDFEAAIDQFKEALDLKKDFPDGWNNLGYCYRMVAKTYLTQSGDAYENALKYDPEHEAALEYQGEYFIMLGELMKSYENYKTLKKMNSADAKLLKEALDPVLKQAKDILKSYSP